ncbi:MAG: hypothetical protein EDR02_18625 [Actinobacteria bacterium]|nr:MAG: hypothetical protein EDR02_18625 [Actinomycetota bacterium]RIK02002.1 MAG: hypothetical protein DCC48_18545 [Acidobacteriota bacterium]
MDELVDVLAVLELDDEGAGTVEVIDDVSGAVVELDKTGDSSDCAGSGHSTQSPSTARRPNSSSLTSASGSTWNTSTESPSGNSSTLKMAPES